LSIGSSTQRNSRPRPSRAPRSKPPVLDPAGDPLPGQGLVELAEIDRDEVVRAAMQGHLVRLAGLARTVQEGLEIPGEQALRLAPIARREGLEARLDEGPRRRGRGILQGQGLVAQGEPVGDPPGRYRARQHPLGRLAAKGGTGAKEGGQRRADIVQPPAGQIGKAGRSEVEAWRLGRRRLGRAAGDEHQEEKARQQAQGAAHREPA
jgi:hypothetical protein